MNSNKTVKLEVNKVNSYKQIMRNSDLTCVSVTKDAFAPIVERERAML